jgi:fatty acid desaturase
VTTGKEDPKSVARRFFNFCLLLLGGIVLLYLALELLAHFWGWLVLLGVVVTAIWALMRIVSARRDRW